MANIRMSNLKVYLNPMPHQVEPETGIGRVILAMGKYLPEYGIDLIDDTNRADVIACHVNRPTNVPRVDVLHLHGLYFSDIPHERYTNYHHEINRGIVQAIREAKAVTVPSEWVAYSLQRDFRINPTVISHGIDVEEWKGGDNLHHILWNKNRPSDVCDPTPAWELANAGEDVVTTFPPNNKPVVDNLRVTGVLPDSKMRVAIACADVYLATTLETFGIGTLEAMACGVPVLGYDWGGTHDIVRHGVDGYLVEPGNIQGLFEGLRYIRENRDELSVNARARAEEFTWRKVMGQYAALYRQIAGQAENAAVAVVVPNFNYAQYLPDCIHSLQSQTCPPDEIIVVDDGSTDNSREIISDLSANDSRIKAIFQENQGVAAARNAGISASSSEFVICLDADDMLAPEYIETCLDAMHNDRSLGVAYTGLALWGDNGSLIPGNWPPEFDWAAQSAVSVPPSNCIPIAAMFRRSMWERAGGYMQVYAPAEDTEFWTRGLSVGFNARKVSSSYLFHYRTHEGSASRTKKYHAIDTWHPWMRDKQYPAGAPQIKKPLIRSYALPGVSVIIPVGPGHEQFLPAALDSLLGQTYRNWEAIVIDDSNGEWGNILRPYPFVKIHKTARPGQGAGAARNIGLREASAPFVLFLDADDYLDPSALEKMLKFYSESNGRYVYTDWVAIGEKNDMLSEHQSAEYDPLAWFDALGGRVSGIHGVTALIYTQDARKALFDESLPGWEEVDYFTHLAVQGIHGARLPEPLFYYRTATGTRRNTSLENEKTLAGAILNHFSEYLKGEKDMSTCCGGDAGAAVLMAKRMIGEALPAANADPSVNAVTVRMEFIGAELGPVWYQGKDGSNRRYQGASVPEYRFADVNPEDVSKLESLGKWRRVSPMPEMVINQPVPTGLSEAERMALARSNLMRVKQMAEAQANEQENAPVQLEPAAIAADVQTAQEVAVQSTPVNEIPAKQPAPEKRTRQKKVS